LTTGAYSSSELCSGRIAQGMYPFKPDVNTSRSSIKAMNFGIISYLRNVKFNITEIGDYRLEIFTPGLKGYLPRDILSEHNSEEE